MKPFIPLQVLALGILLLACPGTLESPPPDGSGTRNDGATNPQKDQYTQKQDTLQPPNPDSYQPPKQDAYQPPKDWYQPPKPDSQPWKLDKGYTGSPFGCVSNADCFGMSCCPTPWGVKLCAEDCTW